MHDVITIGSATLDVFLTSDQLDVSEIDGKKKLLLPYGEKVTVSQALFETGGGATNAATTFARQGLDVAVVAKTGKDFPASRVIDQLKKENINTQHLIQDENDTTDFSTIIWAPMKGTTILVNRGQGKIEVSDVDWDSLNTKWFYISSVEGNLDILKEVESFCDRSEQETKIAWNPGKREIKHKDIVFDLLSCIELLIINHTEANLLLETTVELDNQDHLKMIVEKFPSTTILITDGHNGSYYWNGNSWYHAGVFEITRQEATGAGDAFGSAFVAGLVKGLNEEDCLKLASANAASVVTAPSAKQGILTEEKTREWMGKELEIVTI